MPTVPRLTPELPDVGSLPTPFHTGSGPAQPAQMLGEALVGFGQAFQQAQAQADQARVQDALNQAYAFRSQLEHHPQEGYRAQQGPALWQRDSGLPLSDEYPQKYAEHLHSLQASLATPAQKQIFAQQAQQDLTHFTTQVQRYETEQGKRYAISVQQAAVMQQQEALLSAYPDAEATSLAVSRLQAAHQSLAQLTGQAPEWAQAQSQRLISQAHRQALLANLHQDLPAAQTYWQQFKSQLTVLDHQAVVEQLQAQQAWADGSDAAQAVISSWKPQDALPSLTQALEQLQQKLKQANPQTQQAGASILTRELKRLEVAKQAQQDQALAQAMVQLEANGGDYQQVAADLKAQLRPQQRSALFGFAQRLVKQQDHSDLGLYETLATHPEQLGKLSDDQFYALKAHLSQADFKHFAQQRAQLLSGEVALAPSHLDQASINRILQNRLALISLAPQAHEGSKKRAKRAAIRRWVEHSLLEIQQQSGKKLNPLELEQQIDQLFTLSIPVAKPWYQGKGVQQKRLLDFKPEDVPAAVKTELEKQGLTPAEQLSRYWQQQSAQKP